MTIYIGNDNLITLKGLYDVVAGAYANSATVTWTITHNGGPNIASGTLTYVAGSRGTYTGVIEEDVNFTGHPHYHLNVTADAGSDRIAYWSHFFVPVVRDV